MGRKEEGEEKRGKIKGSGVNQSVYIIFNLKTVCFYIHGNITRKLPV
jgi:hypothetical protein